MSFNKNNPNAVGKIMGLLRQLSTDMGSEQQRRSGQGDEERLYRTKGPKYARVPSKPTLSASTTCTSLATSCGSQATLTPNTYASIPETVTTESSDEDEQETFEKTRLHFQQLRQISLGNEYKYKMEMEIKSAKDENLRNSVPYVQQLSTDTMKSKDERARADRDGSISTVSGPTSHKIYLRTQVLAALAVSMGSMVVGYSSGYTSPALDTMQHENSTVKVNTGEASWVGGIMPLAALVGGVLGGPLIEYVGRRNTILATAVPFIVAWLCIATAYNVAMILTGRAISGFCVGVASLSFPVYLGETVQPEVRGSLGLFPTAFGNIGILVIYTAGKYLDWSQLAYLGAALPVPFLVLMLLIPETPRWYITRNNRERAYNSLRWLRGKDACIEHELRDIERSQNEANKTGGSTFFLLFSRAYFRPVLISLGLMFFQQLSGINAVIFYTVQIFKTTGSTIDGNLSTIIIGLVNFVSTFIATVLIDRLGRKILLYISAISMILSLGTLGTFFYLRDVTGLEVQDVSWLPVLCCVIYVLGFSLGFGPIPWLMMGEILPGKIRGTAASVATGFNWLCTFIVTKTFLEILNVLGAHGTFWLFGGITFVGLFFVIFCVPETQGKSLEEIENKLVGRVRRMSSVANLKPLPSGF